MSLAAVDPEAWMLHAHIAPYRELTLSDFPQALRHTNGISTLIYRLNEAVQATRILAIDARAPGVPTRTKINTFKAWNNCAGMQENLRQSTGRVLAELVDLIDELIAKLNAHEEDDISDLTSEVSWHCLQSLSVPLANTP